MCAEIINMSGYKPAFTVMVGDHEYSVWSDGQISGFGDGKAPVTIFNRIPEVIRDAARAAPERDIRMQIISEMMRTGAYSAEMIDEADKVAQYVLTGKKPGAEG